MLGSRKHKFKTLLGQFLIIHGSFITFFPLHFPPCLSLIDTVLILVRVPGPHVLLQSFTFQDPHSQSIATAKEVVKDEHIIRRACRVNFKQAKHKCTIDEALTVAARFFAFPLNQLRSPPWCNLVLAPFVHRLIISFIAFIRIFKFCT